MPYTKQLQEIRQYLVKRDNTVLRCNQQFGDNNEPTSCCIECGLSIQIIDQILEQASKETESK